MLPAEVVISEVEAQSGFVVLPLLRERTSQPSHSLDESTDAQVVSFNVASAYPILVRITDDNMLVNFRDGRW